MVLLSETMASDLREISKIFQMYYKCSNHMWLIHFHVFRSVFRKHNVCIIYFRHMVLTGVPGWNTGEKL